MDLHATPRFAGKIAYITSVWPSIVVAPIDFLKISDSFGMKVTPGLPRVEFARESPPSAQILSGVDWASEAEDLLQVVFVLPFTAAFMHTKPSLRAKFEVTSQM